jgi:hypothetical protein
MKPKLLIVGVVPPPIGGVSVHVARLLDSLVQRGEQFAFADIKKLGLLQLFKAIAAHKIVHIHMSNSYVRLVLVIFARSLGKQVIFTLHRSLGRGGKISLMADMASIRFAQLPLMLNAFSYDKAKKANKNTRLVSAFIPPGNEPPLASDVCTAVADLKTKYEQVWATNAYHASFDKFGREIYQLTLLVDIFAGLPGQALVISDPSGSYKLLFEQNGTVLPPNVLLLAFGHSFYRLLEITDGLLRITTTDGDSLSVKEALYLNKTVIATNVVDRPAGVYLVNLNQVDVSAAITSRLSPQTNSQLINAADQLIDVYNSLAAFD